MATPQSTTEGEAPKNNEEQITFRFCSECSNMLYPKEDEDSAKLMFTCRTCQYTEEATSSCVFRHVLNSAAGETAGVTQDVGSDPTVCAPVSLTFSHSRHTGGDSGSPGDFDPALCLLCGSALLQCGVCGEPASTKEYNDYQQRDSNLPIDLCRCCVGKMKLWAKLAEDTSAKPSSSRPFEESLADYLSLGFMAFPDKDQNEDEDSLDENYDF
ncbi:hypothetical protein NUW58_g7588 [Xylaria curta]|uniref:Uncharacterized protein n=1 Tax=Xylaria curta TaxID=42375 RepID=A0ACC1NI89_9PEZI|nr:hypothetical protein NUW58_g7588 [Xylaria curta]